MRATLLLAAFVVFAGCANGSDDDEIPLVDFEMAADPGGPGGTLTVTRVENFLQPALDWSQVEAQGCILPEGTVVAGDVVTCKVDDPVPVVHKPSGVLLYTARFA